MKNSFIRREIAEQGSRGRPMVMTRSKSRLAAIFVATVLALAGSFGVASSATAAPDSVKKIVALGDSIAAGQGGGAPLDGCGRTNGGYGSQLDAMPKYNLLRNAACSGDTIADVAATQLSQVNRGTTVVTLTVGVNDLGLDQLYGACAAAAAAGPLDPAYQACLDFADQAAAYAPALTPPLTALIGAISQRSPNATIVVTGYPYLLEAPPALDQFAWLALIVAKLDVATDALNTAIQGAVVAAVAADVDARYADVVDRFLGHGAQLVPVDPSQQWIGFDLANDPAGYLHPTYAGYTAYATEINDQLTAP